MNSNHPSAPLLPGEESTFDKNPADKFDHSFLKNDLFEEFSRFKGNGYVYKMYQLDDEK